MADRGDTDGVLVVCQLIDDAVGAHTQRAQASEPTECFVAAVPSCCSEVLNCIWTLVGRSAQTFIDLIHGVLG